MNIKDYEYIVAINDQGSISKAANMLYITQSALTRFLQRVEAEVGLPLFYRHGNKFLLTHAGQFYVDKGREIIRMDREIASELKSMALNNSSYIRLGCGMGRLTQVIDYVLPAFYKLHPDFRISLRSFGSADLSRMVETNQIDIALLSSVKKSPNISYIPLGNIYASLAVPESSTLLGDIVEEPGYPYPVLRNDRWLSEPYICLDQATSSGRIADVYFETKGITPKVILDVGDVSTALTAIESGLGNSILLSIPLRGRAIQYCCLPDLNVETGNFNIAMRHDYFVNFAAEDLIKIIVENFA